MEITRATNGSLYPGGGQSLERPVPYDLQAEEAVLGALLLDRDAIIKVATFLAPHDFYREANGWIYECILDLYHRREPPDLVTLSSELDRRGRLEPVGGLAYLAGLMHRVPTAVHVEYYARIVERNAVLRRLITVGGQIAGLGYEEVPDLPVVLDKAESLLFGVTQRQGPQDFVSIKRVLEEYFDRLDVVQHQKGHIIGVPTGFHALDELTGGLQQSDLVIVAARPSVGKSSFGLSIAYNAAVMHGKSVGIFSLEMSAEQLVQRLLSIASGIETQRLRLGYLNEGEWQKLSDAFGALAAVPLYFDDSAGLSINEVRSRARRLQAEAGCDLLVVDYLQLMSGRRGGGGDNRVQEVSEISRGLKTLARELNVPVIAMSQLSRAVESRTSHVPMLSDLRESGSIEQDADIVMFIYREELYNPETERKNIAEIHVAKHRNGPIGVVPLFFQNATTHFRDLDLYRQPN
ncbi:MAG TPA: replicative DNA helicase [Chloroflexia bacterium]|nr:replicative DNA helicase [Chloroflexia bacterium]